MTNSHNDRSAESWVRPLATIHESEIECVALAIERQMFALHELPLDAELHGKYRATAVAALMAMPMPSVAQPARDLSSDQIMEILHRTVQGELLSLLSITRWKDGIDVKIPSMSAEVLAREFIKAAAQPPAAPVETKSDGGGNAVGVPAGMQGSNDRGLAHDDVKPEDTTQGDRPARPVTCPPSDPKCSAATEGEPQWWKMLADNWRGRNGNTVTGDSVRNSCADELEKVAARHHRAVPQAPQLREALFPKDIVEDGGKYITTLDASYNLQGALYDIKHHRSNGRPPDKACIDTIERVIGQLEAARAALSLSRPECGGLLPAPMLQLPINPGPDEVKP